ncbi:glycosyltransferase family protein [Pseudomonas guineae]|uniref:glycosyltransferase family protein n=1 Tax=Pseudomonas guineae TaxID=425504 RepID=UPI003D048255
MKVLFLVQKEQRAILDRLYESVQAHCECDLRWLTREDQADLKGYFKREVDFTRYDRILFFLRFKQEMRQVGFIASLPNLVILEHDAYQNYIPCKYTGKFSRHYRQLPSARVISSGYMVVQRLLSENVDACFVPKGYDQVLLRNEHRERDIELAFVGSLRSVAYSGRRAMLESLGAVEDLVITRTKSGDEYRQTLSRIRFFVSADVGMGEYMIKNFEAMACGCVLFAFNQGEKENQALGFVDMHNIVLYSDLAELRTKLKHLREHEDLASAISRNGQQLAEQNFTFQVLGRSIVDVMRAPLRPKATPSWWNQLRRAIGR